LRLKPPRALFASSNVDGLLIVPSAFSHINCVFGERINSPKEPVPNSDPSGL